MKFPLSLNYASMVPNPANFYLSERRGNCFTVILPKSNSAARHMAWLQYFIAIHRHLQTDHLQCALELPSTAWTSLVFLCCTVRLFFHGKHFLFQLGFLLLFQTLCATTEICWRVIFEDYFSRICVHELCLLTPVAHTTADSSTLYSQRVYKCQGFLIHKCTGWISVTEVAWKNRN